MSGAMSPTGPKRRFTALQRYVRSWSTSRHSADMVNVPSQPRHASLIAGKQRSSSGSFAMLAAMCRASPSLLCAGAKDITAKPTLLTPPAGMFTCDPTS
jgi:hypothetical protein